MSTKPLLGHQVSFSSDDHDADTQTSKNDISDLLSLGLGNEHVVNQRREDESDEGDGQAANETDDNLEERTDDGDEGDKTGHEDSENHSLLVLDEDAFFGFS